MRRAPLLLAILSSLGVMVVLSGNVFATGHATTKSSNSQSTQTSHSQSTKTSPSQPHTGDRDVRGNAFDPSQKSGHDRDNGKGNDCDPGFGGSVTEHGNDNRPG